MRPIIRLLGDTFGIKSYFIVPAAIFIIIFIIEGGTVELSKVVNPANVGALTLLMMIGFGSHKGLLTLLKLLPAKPGKVTAALQITLYLVLLLINAPYLLLSIVLEKLSPSGITLQYTAVFLIINLIFMITLFNFLLPLLLLKGFKPLKITVMCITLAIPFFIGDVASIMAKRLGDSTFTAITVFGIIAVLSCLLCYRLSKGRIRAYEA